MSVQVHVELDGNFFHKDPAKTLYRNIRDLMDQLAEWGEGDVRSQIETHHRGMPNWTGWTLDHVKGRTSSLGGKRWAVSAVVSANTAGMSAKDAIRTKAAAATIERRWHPFRRTAGRMRSARPLLSANLTKGIE